MLYTLNLYTLWYVNYISGKVESNIETGKDHRGNFIVYNI